MQLQEIIQYSQSVVEHLRRRWETEYTAQLRIFHQVSDRTVGDGDLVYVKSDTKKRTD